MSPISQCVFSCPQLFTWLEALVTAHKTGKCAQGLTAGNAHCPANCRSSVRTGPQPESPASRAWKSSRMGLTKEKIHLLCCQRSKKMRPKDSRRVLMCCKTRETRGAVSSVPPLAPRLGTKHKVSLRSANRWSWEEPWVEIIEPAC